MPCHPSFPHSRNETNDITIIQSKKKTFFVELFSGKVHPSKKVNLLLHVQESNLWGGYPSTIEQSGAGINEAEETAIDKKKKNSHIHPRTSQKKTLPKNNNNNNNKNQNGVSFLVWQIKERAL